MRRLAILLLWVACGFQRGSLGAGDGGRGDGADGADMDAAPPTPCVEKWRSGPALTTPMAIATVNSTSPDADVSLSADELTLYLARNGDIYKTSRVSITDDFGTPMVDADLSSSQSDTKVTFTADGLQAFFNSRRTGNDSDVWRATRASVADPFGNIDRMHLAAVNTSVDQWDPHISANGLRIYLAPSRSPEQAVVVARRDSLSADFDAPQVIAELDSMLKDNDPTVTADERVIVFASNRGTTRALWYATRPDADAAFSAPQLVPGLDSSASDDGPHLSLDGCRLYFVSARAGGDDIYVSELL